MAKSHEAVDLTNEGGSLCDNAPRLRIRLTFGRSSSKSFGDAVQLASSLPDYRVSGEGRHQVHRIDTTLDINDAVNWDRVSRLWSLVDNWKMTNGELAGTEETVPVSRCYRLCELTNCLAERAHSDYPAGYCCGKSAPDDEREYFGCRRVQGVVRSLCGGWPGWFSWYQMGKLSHDQQRFVVDKEAIIQHIKRKTGTDLCTVCPFFSWAHVRAAVQELPDTVELDESSLFVVKHSQVNPSQALGIIPRDYEEFEYVADVPERFRRIPGHSAPAQEEELANDQEDYMERPLHEAYKGECKRNVPSVRYSDVAGQDVALRQINDVVQLPLIHPEYFQNVGVQPQNGIILHGPPGNGKTLIAKAVANQCDAHLEIISGPEVLSKWVGESEDNLRQVFERARKLQPSVVLIDEIDAIAPRRDLVSQQHEVTLISQLLVLLDGLEERGRVVVIATTNRVEAVDAAIRRPGRFDYLIEVPMPDEEGRKAILDTCLRDMKKSRELETSRVASVSRIANLAEGFSGADLAALCREAGLIAIKKGIAAGVDATEVAICEPDLIAAFEAICQKRTNT